MVLPEHIISHTNAAVFLHVTEDEKILPPLKGLSFLDRFLVIWIILAMAIGIVLGNTVDSVGPALQKGEFVGVSIPIGTCLDVPIPVRTGATSAVWRSSAFHRRPASVRLLAGRLDIAVLKVSDILPCRAEMCSWSSWKAGHL
jgi:hypothetical protein